MRMWGVDVTKMCNKHLLGEHVEMHMLVGSINKGTSLEGFFNNNLIDVTKVVERHEQLVIEMEKRGMKHKSPLPSFKMREELKRGKIDIKFNEKDLKKRCSECNF